MKNPIKYLFAVFMLSFILSGCYTVIWSPEDEFPAAHNDYDDYYGGFYPPVFIDYYDMPWWYRITPPTQSEPYKRGETTESIRNNDGGRSSSNPRDIINTPPPTRSGGTSSNGNNSGNTSTAPQKRTESNDNSGNTQRGNSSDSGSVRNNDGNRNSGGRR